MTGIFESVANAQQRIKEEDEAQRYRQTGGDPLLMGLSRNANNLGTSIGNSINHMLGRPKYDDPRLKKSQEIESLAKQSDITTSDGLREFARSLNKMGYTYEALRAVEHANRQQNDRKVITGRDGYQYYQDTQKRVLPDVNNTSERKYIKAADGYNRYIDTGEKVIPGVTKDNSKQIYEDQMKREELNFDRSAKLRGEFTKESKVFNDVTDSFIRVQKSVEQPSAAGDLALIFNYMKMLDPGSVVREGEFANAQNSGSIPQVIRARYNKVLRGERLSDTQRVDFYDRAQKLYSGAKGKQQSLMNRYEKLANVYGLSPKNIIYDYGVLTEEINPTLNQQKALDGKQKADYKYNPETGRIE